VPVDPHAPGRGVIRFPDRVAASPGHESPHGGGSLGMGLFLASLGVLFAATLVAYLAVRLGAAAETRALAPSLPAGLWAGTALLAAASVTVQAALGAARTGRRERLRALLALTTLLGVAFLAAQAASWLVMLRAERAVAPALGGVAGVYLVQFYFLTGLHAAHVLGGLVLMAHVTRTAWLGRYSPAWHQGVRHAATYWHFLGMVWLILFAALLATH